MKLTDSKCRTAKPRDKAFNLTDGHGLYLLIRPNGSKLWRQDYNFLGKRRTASHGPYPKTGLAQARDKSQKLKNLIIAGIDPAIGEGALPDDRPTFEDAAREWFKTKESGWKTSYSKRIWNRVVDDVLPDLGSMAVADIDAPTVLTVLRKIENRDAYYTARRIHQMTSQIFKLAIANGLIKINPAADLHVALKAVPKAVPRSALSEKQLPDFFAALARYRGEESTALALRLVAHTFVRTAEIRFAKWNEIESDIWVIPPDRMKMGRELRVPLSRQAKAIFARLRELSNGSEWVLPGVGGHKPVSENTLLYAMYRLNDSRATVHGFRATASTILNESALFRPDVIEQALAHAPDDKIRAAYNRGIYWQERVEMYQWYSDLLDRHEKAGIENDLSGLLV